MSETNVRRKKLLSMLLAGAAALSAHAGTAPADDPLFPDVTSLPAAGATDVRFLTNDLIQARWVTRHESWDRTELTPPEPSDFLITADGRSVKISEVGFRRMPVHADYHRLDVTILNEAFLRTASPLPAGTHITVAAPDFWRGTVEAELLPLRFSPAIHINHAGYVPGFPKSATVSLDMGSLGEMALPDGIVGRLLNAEGKTVFEAPLVHRPDRAWRFYQNVWRFDFTDFNTPGVYRIEVEGLGRSAPLRIHSEAFLAAARLHALGMYHQRSGFEKSLPFTRITHKASHTAPAEVPDGSASFSKTDKHVRDMARKNSEGQTAPVMDGVSASLYPILRNGPIDVSGGHFDAGDYSKYTVNSSALIAALVFAVDNFPGVVSIDNLGLPESADGVPDALQIAKWEADFLVKMQDSDGGFFFLVYPRDRAYELDVLPQNGDPQVVFPKNTIATGAAVGALAQCAASPHFRRHYPAEAARFLEAARVGYAFLKRAVAKHGFEGALQAISHYGAFSGHTDELAYAAAALFAATGEKSYEDDLRAWWPDPAGSQSSRWGWWPLFESYGSAARVYAFAESNGTLRRGTSDPAYLSAMREAILRGGHKLLGFAQSDAFGIALPPTSKRREQVGYFWAMDFAFDFATASLLASDPAERTAFRDAIVDAFGFEFGANPANRAFVSGAGPVWRRQVVNRITLNDDRTLAVPGIATGNVVSTPHNLTPYKIEGTAGLRRLFFPSLKDFSFLERAATDAYNVRAEFVTATTARILAAYLFLTANTPAAAEEWRPIEARIAATENGSMVTARLVLPDDVTLGEATVVWEPSGGAPATGETFRGIVPEGSDRRLEAEVVWPDGRRAFAVWKPSGGGP